MTSEAGYFWDEYEEDDQDTLSEYTYGVDLGGLREEGGDRVGVVWQEEEQEYLGTTLGAWAEPGQKDWPEGRPMMHILYDQPDDGSAWAEGDEEHYHWLDEVEWRLLTNSASDMRVKSEARR